MMWLKTILLSAGIAWGSTMGARMPRWWAHRTGEIAAWLRIPATSVRRPLQAAIYHRIHRPSLQPGSLMSALRLRFLCYKVSRKIPVPVLLGIAQESSPACIQASYRSFMKQYHPDRTAGRRSQQWATELVAYVNDHRSELFRSKF